ncbi:MAG: DnaJ domain-containing protein, partial [Candidatus Rokuibacteriota bacterium]
MPSVIDAYRTLQIAPDAEDIVVEAAFRALARRYHPDGEAPDEAHMADLNRAYNMLRTPVARRKYDRDHGLRPVGPGLGSVRPAPIPDAPPTNGAALTDVIDFGRYQGWSLKDLARQDPDYLRWLARSSGGVRYRHAILRLLPD